MPPASTFTGDAAGTIADGETISLDVVPGTYTSTETVPDGWVLSSIVCDDDDSVGDRTTATATFEVAAGETVTCTFTNTSPATLTIEKVTDPVDSGADSFDFNAPSTGMSNFTLDTNAGDATNPSERTFTFGADFGVKNIVEAATTGWTLTDITCDDGSGQHRTPAAVRP